MNEEIRQSKQRNQENSGKEIYLGPEYFQETEEFCKLWERICRAIQNNEKEFLWNYKGIGEIKVTLRQKIERIEISRT